VGIGGGKNAALLAIQILALDNAEIRNRLHQFRAKQSSTSRAKNKKI
jgi:phosphoribosylcarboxyaminoimidazole (NCAIR) mutase